MKNIKRNIFDDILLGYFRKSVREKCDDIDKDIIGAIELEQRLKERIRVRSENDGSERVFEQVSAADAQRHILEVIRIMFFQQLMNLICWY